MKEKLKSDVKQIQIICDYLIKECEHDKHLAERIMLENKTLNGMYQYIMVAVKNKFKNQIQNNGVMVKDEDVYSLAIHYFIEDDETLKKEFPQTVTKAEVNKNTDPVKKDEPKIVAAVKKEVKHKTEKNENTISLFDLEYDDTEEELESEYGDEE